MTRLTPHSHDGAGDLAMNLVIAVAVFVLFVGSVAGVIRATLTGCPGKGPS